MMNRRLSVETAQQSQQQSQQQQYRNDSGATLVNQISDVSDAMQSENTLVNNDNASAQDSVVVQQSGDLPNVIVDSGESAHQAANQVSLKIVQQIEMAKLQAYDHQSQSQISPLPPNTTQSNEMSNASGAGGSTDSAQKLPELSTPIGYSRLHGVANQSSASVQAVPAPNVLLSGHTRKLSHDKHSSSSSSSSKHRAQLLHKRPSASKVQSIPANDIIMSTNLEELAVLSNIPQWLIYSWTCKKDKTISDKKTHCAIAELFVLKQYVLATQLAQSASISQQDQLAKNMLQMFQNAHRILAKASSSSSAGSSTTSQTDLGSPSVQHSKVIKDRSNSGGSQMGGVSNQPAGSDLDLSPADRTQQQPQGNANHPGPLKKPPIPAGIRRRDHCIAFLETMIIAEIEANKYEQNLFRQNTMVSKLLTLYANQNAKDYLVNMLQNVIDDVLRMGSFEVDPAKMIINSDSSGSNSNASSQNPEYNMKKLLQACQMVLDAVVASSSKCPIGLQKLCYIIQKQVDMRFKNGRRINDPQTGHNVIDSSVLAGTDGQDDGSQSATTMSPGGGNGSKFKMVAISGFMFLRFICPAIVTPETSGIVKSPLNSKQRRSLVLISKVLQNLANGVRFGSKEAYMTPANSFLVDNEPQLYKFCHQIQDVESEGLYWVTESVDQEKDGQSLSDSVSALQQLLIALNQQMSKIQHELESVQISEVMTYTVFGALKSIIKRFELIERTYDVLYGTDTSVSASLAAKNPLDFSQRDQEMLNNSVLLGGLEEVLLMNRYVLIKALMNPVNFLAHRSLLQMPTVYATMGANVGSQAANLNREMDTIARSVIQVLGPHGGLKLVDVIEWVIDQEVSKRQEMAFNNGSGQQLTTVDVLKKCLEGPQIPRSEEDKAQCAQHNATFGTSMSFKLLISFMFAHTKEYLKPLLQDTCLEVWSISASCEIDPSQLKPDENLKSNLDNLVAATMKIIRTITSNIVLIPECMRKSIRMMYTRLGGRLDLDSVVDSYAVQNENAIRWVSNFLFLRYFCPVIGSPAFYGVITPDQIEGTDVQSAGRTFVLISYMIRFLIARVNQEKDNWQSQDSMPYEEEILGPMLEEWKSCVVTFIKQILNALPSLPSGNLSHVQSESVPSLAESKLSKNSVQDAPVMISASSRSKGLLYLRKILTPYAIKYLKTLVDLKDFKQSAKFHRHLGPQPVPERSDFDLMTPSRDSNELSGLRIESVQYKFMDRIRVVLSSIYKDLESQSLPKDIASSRQNTNSLQLPSVPPISEGNEGTNGSQAAATRQAGGQITSDDERFNRPAGFVAVSNKARRGMTTNVNNAPSPTELKLLKKDSLFSSSGKSDKFNEEFSAIRISDAGEVGKSGGSIHRDSSIPKDLQSSVSASKWQLKSNSNAISLATKSIVKGIFSSVRFGGGDDHSAGQGDFDESVIDGNGGKKKSGKVAQTNRNTMMNPATVGDGERGLLNLIRRHRAEVATEDGNPAVSDAQSSSSGNGASNGSVSGKQKKQDKFSITQLKGGNDETNGKQQARDQNAASTSSSSTDIDEKGIIDTELDSGEQLSKDSKSAKNSISGASGKQDATVLQKKLKRKSGDPGTKLTAAQVEKNNRDRQNI
ncbi:hypothetical protein MP228_002463 [Amoeboaphelidium protococcarum]|nr:hypothetical protein MP228_002463 [Amoeboaphelidium protococcarum]